MMTSSTSKSMMSQSILLKMIWLMFNYLELLIFKRINMVNSLFVKGKNKD